MNSRLMQKLGISKGSTVVVNGAARLPVSVDDTLPDDCVRIPAGHPSTVAAGAMFGAVALAKGS